MKRVLFCTPYEGVSNSNIGGISVWAKAVVAYYENMGQEVELVLQPMDRKTYVRGVNAFVRIWRGIVEYFSLVKKVNKLIGKEPFDTVHLCTTASLGLIKDYFILRHAKSKGVKTILHFHCGRIPQIIRNNNWETNLLKQVLKNTDIPVVMDNSSMQTLKELGAKNATYVPNPLSSFVSETVCRFNGDIERVDKRLLFVGHVVDIKGVYELVEACCRIPDITLRIQGYLPCIS